MGNKLAMGGKGRVNGIMQKGTGPIEVIGIERTTDD